MFSDFIFYLITYFLFIFLVFFFFFGRGGAPKVYVAYLGVKFTVTSS